MAGLGIWNTRRSFLGTAGGAGAAALAAACAPSGGGAIEGGAGGTKKPVRIAYWGKWDGANQEPEEAVIANFQQKLPHITVDGPVIPCRSSIGNSRCSFRW